MYLFFQTFFARKLALIFTMISLWTLLSKYFISMVSERPWSILCSSSWLRVNKGQNRILYNIRMSLLKSRIAKLQFLSHFKKNSSPFYPIIRYGVGLYLNLQNLIGFYSKYWHICYSDYPKNTLKHQPYFPASCSYTESNPC